MDLATSVVAEVKNAGGSAEVCELDVAAEARRQLPSVQSSVLMGA